MLLLGLVLIAVAAAIVAVGFQNNETIPYEVHDVPLESGDGDDKASAKETGIDWDSLPASVVAWVRVPGTTVDYPVVQEDAQDVSFYLEHDMNGDYSAWGTPYIDADCQQGVNSPFVMVYGHHMSDGTMFAPLAQYSDSAFAAQHRKINVYTRDKSYKLRVFAVDVLDASVEGKWTDIADTTELRSYIDGKLSECELVLERPDDMKQVWAFVTCSYQSGDSRTVVYAMEPNAN